MKNFTPAILTLLLPTVTFATYYDQSAFTTPYMVGGIHILLQFLFVPIFVIVCMSRIVKYAKTKIDDPLKKKRRTKVYRSIILLCTTILISFLLIKSPFSSVPCGFNMTRSCPIKNIDVINHYFPKVTGNTGFCGVGGEFCPGTPGYNERMKREGR